MITFSQNDSRCKIPSSKTNKAGDDPERLEHVHRRHRWRRNQISPSVAVNPANRKVAIGHSPSPYPTNHMVSLGNAHQSGAWNRPAERKKLYSQLPGRPTTPYRTNRQCQPVKEGQRARRVETRSRILLVKNMRNGTSKRVSRMGLVLCSYGRIKTGRNTQPCLSKSWNIASVYSGTGMHSTTRASSSPAGVNKTPFIGRDAVSVADSNNQL